ncbi:hypothetical protein LTS18_005018 [Coniosporium uncinatum]|uniref:Uncharacterized protein n=1 Tax=Coniosporium uncinatum TaxID=93489 RepID=A0ACC3D528_9PEZI|nr:hypothetical protein LTS18_005018 [Coniosporium uncinatum]
MATEASPITTSTADLDMNPALPLPSVPSHIAPQTVLTTLHSFPALEPLKFIHYPTTHLSLPLRKDILHRAIVYEGDATRSGTASTKWRDEVRGSGKKIRPQKGSGKARLGDKKSPMLRGGGRAFGPKPRDFSTGLQKKVYDLAWRTALSYRWRRGELVVVEDGADIEQPDKHLARQIFTRHGWGTQDKRSLLITKALRPNIFEALEAVGKEGKALEVDDVDVKDLLSLGRLVIERGALDRMFIEHQSDIVPQHGLQIERNTGSDRGPAGVMSGSGVIDMAVHEEI